MTFSRVIFVTSICGIKLGHLEEAGTNNIIVLGSSGCDPELGEFIRVLFRGDFCDLHLGDEGHVEEAGL